MALLKDTVGARLYSVSGGTFFGDKFYLARYGKGDGRPARRGGSGIDRQPMSEDEVFVENVLQCTAYDPELYNKRYETNYDFKSGISTGFMISPDSDDAKFKFYPDPLLKNPDFWLKVASAHDPRMGSIQINGLGSDAYLPGKILTKSPRCELLLDITPEMVNQVKPYFLYGLMPVAAIRFLARL